MGVQKVWQSGECEIRAAETVMQTSLWIPHCLFCGYKISRQKAYSVHDQGQHRVAGYVHYACIGGLVAERHCWVSIGIETIER